MVDASDFRRIMSHYPTGVCIVSAMVDDMPYGMVIGSFNSVSLDPPLVGFFPARRSQSWPKMEATGRFFINILGSDQDALCAQFAGAGAQRFDGVEYELSTLGSPHIEGAIAGIDCELHGTRDAGDHLLVLGRVHSMDLYRDADPMLFLKGEYGGFRGF